MKRHLPWFQFWPPDAATCISNKFGHQVVPLVLPHCFWLPFWHHQLVLSWYLHQPESHQLSLQKVLESLSQWETSGPIDRTPGTPGSDKKRASVKHYPQTTTLSTASYNFWSQENWMFDANFSWVGQTFQSVSLCVRGGKLPNVQRGGESQQISTFSSSSGTLMSHLCWTAGPA